jgi:hypothetical protein
MNQSSSKQVSEKKLKQPKGNVKRAEKRADLGLTAKERLFVHSLRQLFDPKGKTRVDVQPAKVIVPELRDMTFPRDGKKKVTGKPKAELRKTTERLAHQLSKKAVVKRAVKKAYDVQDGLLGKGKTVKSPSKLKRAAKRKNLQKKSKTYVPDIPILDVSPGYIAREPRMKGESIGQVKARLVKRLEKERVEKRNLMIAALNPLPKGQQELEVIEAWGGASALGLLSKQTVKKQVGSHSWIPVLQGTGGKSIGIRDSVMVSGKGHAIGRIFRDYTKAVKGVTVLTNKRREGLEKQDRTRSLKSVSPKENSKPSNEKKIKKQSDSKKSSKVRRLEKRAEKRANLKIGQTTTVIKSRGVAELVSDRNISAHPFEGEAAFLESFDWSSLKGESAVKVLQNLYPVLSRVDSRSGNELMMFAQYMLKPEEWDAKKSAP